MAPVTPPFPDVLNSYMRHVGHELYAEPTVHGGLEKVIVLKSIYILEIWGSFDDKVVPSLSIE
jgi:hypothetical protein